MDALLALAPPSLMSYSAQMNELLRVCVCVCVCGSEERLVSCLEDVRAPHSLTAKQGMTDFNDNRAAALLFTQTHTQTSDQM